MRHQNHAQWWKVPLLAVFVLAMVGLPTAQAQEQKLNILVIFGDDFNDDGVLVATRVDHWKFVWCEQRAPGNMLIWANPFTCLRVPKIYNLRMDPYERADITSDQYYDWLVKNAYLAAYGVMKTAASLETFVEYPPSQPPASFSVDQIVENVKKRIEQKQQQR